MHTVQLAPTSGGTSFPGPTFPHSVVRGGSEPPHPPIQTTWTKWSSGSSVEGGATPGSTTGAVTGGAP
jgi:hypothetical protein